MLVLFGFSAEVLRLNPLITTKLAERATANSKTPGQKTGGRCIFNGDVKGPRLEFAAPSIEWVSGAKSRRGSPGGRGARSRVAHSERKASITSMRAARAAGRTEATTAADSRTAAAASTGTASGMRMSTT